MKMLSVVAVAALLTFGAVHAADAVPASQADLQQQDEPIGSPAQASGKITSIHNVTMVGVAEPHVLVKLKSDDGDVDIVDLGSAAELKSNGIDPQEGKQLWVDGRIGKINDKPLVVAESISESKLIKVARTAPLREESQKHAEKRAAGDTTAPATADATAPKDPKAPKTETVDAGMQVRTVEGKVMHSRSVKIEGQTEEHMLAKIQTESGIVVIDMGPSSKMPKVDLTEGQSIAATGCVGKLNGKQLIVADSIGNMSNIQWPNETSAAPTK